MYIIINDEDETYKVCTYPNIKPNTYLISNYGNIINISTGNECRPYKDQKGYMRVSLQRLNGKVTTFKIHRLVAWEYNTFSGDIDKLQPNHLDGIRDHNFYKNIPWSTASENVRHSFIHGNRVNKSGEDHYRNKYKLKTVHVIKKLIGDGMSNNDIMKHFGYTYSKDNKSLYNLIVDIRRNKTWKDND